MLYHRRVTGRKINPIRGSKMLLNIPWNQFVKNQSRKMATLGISTAKTIIKINI